MLFINFIELIKPKILIGNLLPFISGYFLGYNKNLFFKQNIIFHFFIHLIIISLIIASSCVFNNFIDRDIDKIMQRTKNRYSLKISPVFIFIYSIILYIISNLLMFLFSYKLIIYLLNLGFFTYVFLYSYIKRYSYHSILLGSISGGIPPIVGYCSIINNFDMFAFFLFTTFFLWQIPHSYAINIYNIKDYKLANIPVLPIIKNIKQTKKIIIIYIIIFSIVSLIIPIFYCTGLIYILSTLLVNLYWIFISIKNFNINDFYWSKKIFKTSIIVIVNISISLVLDQIIFFKLI